MNDDANDTLGEYLRELGRLPLLTAADERKAAARASSGDGSARKTLIEANLRLVVAIARDYEGRDLGLLELIQEGNIGLMKAVERYDWRGGARFSTFATSLIREAIENALRDD